MCIHRGRGQEKANGDSSAMHCLGVLSRVMLVPQHVGVKHSLHSLEDVVGGTGSTREVSRQGARSKLRIKDLVPKKVSLRVIGKEKKDFKFWALKGPSDTRSHLEIL